ncbi:probable chitinase 2 isoform X3 [Folsomia candida]|uniref:probable chitinase 2 isoform X3 n=1 Tax=Folsomia candida TaxID=158441 RepID=UPI001605543F|nr:probable chitinase 2 isoform X3 [Folsomia candida]
MEFTKLIRAAIIAYFVGVGYGQLQNKVLVCYWGTWSHYRPPIGNFSVDKIPPTLCTNIVYSFFGLDNNTNTIKSLDPWLDYSSADHPDGGLDMLRKTVALRNQNPSLKVTLAIGGWNEGSVNYSIMARTQATRASFISSTLNIIQKSRRRLGISSKEFRAALDTIDTGRGRLLLTSAFGCYEKFLDVSYDIPEISKYLDYFHLMLYDFKMYLEDDGSGEVEPGSNLIGHHAPLYSKDWEDEGNKTMTTSFAVESFIQRGAPANKLVFGVGAYGKTYEIFSRVEHNFYDLAKGPGVKSEITDAPGTSAMFEICRELLDPRIEWEMGFDNDYKIPYAYSDTKFIGYDDTLSARLKTDYAMNNGLAGMMVWSIDFDDFANYCQGWREFPIINAMRDRLLYFDKKAHN